MVKALKYVLTKDKCEEAERTYTYHEAWLDIVCGNPGGFSELNGS